MTFIARIRHHSLVWKNWHHHAKVSGTLHGVVFRWEPAHIYRSGVLSEDQIAQFTNHADVELEMVSVSLPEMGETPITEAAVEDEPLPVEAVNDTPASHPALPPEIKPAAPVPPKAKWQPPERFVKQPPRK
jgi:hypothetical protein